MVLFRDSLPIKNVMVENILKGDYMQLSLIWGSNKVLIKCCYPLYDDIPALDSEQENYFSKFFRIIRILDSLLKGRNL